MTAVHVPVLLEETILYLAPRSDGELMVDATQGEGGHSYAFLSRFPTLRVVGIDADKAIQEKARERLQEFEDRITFYNGWSHDYFAALGAVEKPDTILIDLGVSMYHYEESGRGFSFRKDEPLDMRIDISSGDTAADLIARLPEKELADLIYNNAEERYSRRIARAIVETRSQGAITGSAALAEIVSRAVPAEYRRGRAHPATKTFQALRIAVNGELGRLLELLESALNSLKVGGRMGVISFHSLEDRKVKNFFREKNKECTCPPETPICRCTGHRFVNLLTRKAVAPDQEEARKNPASRSAKLRVVEKIFNEDGQP
ncbi:S-adenosyl-methyltransferase MraW [Treponema primitia ZAS-2]|uniref:Ribosomal RNA small subunit methyltransferase H n=1 Tax=Treponema primitia (strain ATCC BAA-887 / DSM 12427 / ZAS-2) TaxID=545694 RepID=F5YGK3_TREPZ|nr:16S rRNA (cytosine(1402)-N(4))-methyltransferase RsmH [Treponema primitia]AEF86643.1 S-adenosyl-methyltransferase MraW [Treponema primitia ZAS-2]